MVSTIIRLDCCDSGCIIVSTYICDRVASGVFDKVKDSGKVTKTSEAEFDIAVNSTPT